MNWNPRRFTFGFAFIAVFAGLILSGCGGGSSTPKLTALTVAPSTASVAAGSQQPFTATGLFADGTTQDQTSAVSWASSNSAVATIAPGGVATGVAAGTANITATLFGIQSNAAALTVTASSTLVSIAVTPAFPTVIAGGTQQFTATGTYTNVGGPNTTQDITGQVTWASATTAAATITPSGLATGVANGASVITATLSGVTGQTTLTVGVPVAVGLQIAPASPSAAAGTTVQFSALELLSDNTTQPLTGAVTWGSGTSANATIAASTGLAQAIGVGTSVITATEAGTGFTGTTTLTVVAAQARFAYVAALNGFVTDAYSVVPSTGTFTPNGTPDATQPQQVIVHPSGHFLFVVDGNSYVEVFAIDSTTGVITPAAASGGLFPAIQAGSSGLSKAAVDRSGQFLYVVSSNNLSGATDTLYGFTINQTTGQLTAMAGNPITANLSSPSDVQIAHQSGATNDYLYVINYGGNNITEFSIDATSGALTALGTPTVATGSGPYNSTIDPSGTHLYVPNSGDSTVSEYSIAATGLLTQVGTATTVTDGTNTAGFVFNVAVDPTDKYLYVVDSPSLSTPGAVYGFNIGANGAVGTSIGLSVATGNGPAGIAIDPTGVLVAVDNNGDNSIWPYAVGAGGVLTADPLVVTDNAPQYLTFYIAAAGQ